MILLHISQLEPVTFFFYYRPFFQSCIVFFFL